MLALERLSPLERAAFLLHDVFDVPLTELAITLGREPAAVRKLAARARVWMNRTHPDRSPCNFEAAGPRSAISSPSLDKIENCHSGLKYVGTRPEHGCHSAPKQFLVVLPWDDAPANNNDAASASQLQLPDNLRNERPVTGRER